MIKAMDISVGYGGTTICSGINFAAVQGECILLCGPNGAGKTTLLKTLAGAMEPLGGKVSSDGRVIMVPTRIPKVKGFTLKQFIATGCYRDSRWDGRINPSLSKSIDESLEMLGIGPLSGKDISTLSDGEFQKGCIASALSLDASYILLDEPTAFLDPDARAKVLGTIAGVASSKRAGVIFSSHELSESLSIASRVMGIGPDGIFHDSQPGEKNAVVRACFPEYFLSLKD